MKKFSSKLVLLITAFMIFMTPALINVAAEEALDVSNDEIVETIEDLEEDEKETLEDVDALEETTEEAEALEETTEEIEVEAPRASDREFVLLHTNDMHGQITNNDDVKKGYELAYLKSYKELMNATLFDAGDASQGLPQANISKGASMGELMQMVGFKAMAIGNHEFDYSLKSALGIDNGFFKSSPNIKKLATNVVYNEDIDPSIGVANEHVYEKSMITDLPLQDNSGTVKASVFGLATPETPFKADPRNSKGISFLDPLPALKEEILLTEHDASEVFIVLMHLGTDLETREDWRAQSVGNMLATDPELNNRKYIIIDGHSHTENPTGQRFGDNVLYGQTGGALKTVGEMVVNLDDFKQSTTHTITMFPNDKRPEAPIVDLVVADPGVKDKIDATINQFNEDTKEVLLTDNPHLLLGERDFVRTRETNLGNLITDSMLAYGDDTFSVRPHVAVLNGGGIRTSIQPGKITLKDVITVQPFGNRLVQIDVTGRDLKAMYEHSVGTETTDELDENGLPRLGAMGGYLHSSDSIRVKFDPTLPAGERVQDIQIIDHDLNELVPLELDKTYKVVTLEFLAVGGDGYTMLGGAREAGTTDAEVLADFFRSHGDGTNPIDWSVYDPNVPAYRTVPTKFTNEDLDNKLADKVDKAEALLKDAHLYTNDSVDRLRLAHKEAVSLLERLEFNSTLRTLTTLEGVTEEEYNRVLANLGEAIDKIEKLAVEPPKPVDPVDTKDPKTPGTGIETNLPLVSSMIALLAGGGYLALRKKED